MRLIGKHITFGINHSFRKWSLMMKRNVATVVLLVYFLHSFSSLLAGEMDDADKTTWAVRPSKDGYRISRNRFDFDSNNFITVSNYPGCGKDYDYFTCNDRIAVFSFGKAAELTIGKNEATIGDLNTRKNSTKSSPFRWTVLFWSNDNAFITIQKWLPDESRHGIEHHGAFCQMNIRGYLVTLWLDDLGNEFSDNPRGLRDATEIWYRHLMILNGFSDTDISIGETYYRNRSDTFSKKIIIP